MRQPPLQQVTQSTDKRLGVRFLGTKFPYHDAMEQMREAIARVDLGFDEGGGAALLFLEHQDTITTTRLHGTRSFVLDPNAARRDGIDVVETDRGGDVTFHGPGQLVGYLVMRLLSPDLHLYVRSLERALLRGVRHMGFSNSCTIEGKTGVWLSGKDGVRKLIAIGVGVSNGVTRHGFALNVSTDLDKFLRYIVPCGLHGYRVTSIKREDEALLSQWDNDGICALLAAEIAHEFGLATV